MYEIAGAKREALISKMNIIYPPLEVVAPAL